MTGLEFSIPLSVLGNPTGTGIKITAFINGGSHDFLANQVSGTGVLLGNLGGAMPDFELEFPGTDQFVTVPNPVSVGASAGVPEPAAASLAALALAALGATRRRR
jgi:MYXO-CTERM domain-containing protein